MNLPHYLRLALIAFITFTSAVAVAGEPQKFEGEITGVVCPACQEHVTTALLKVDGIKNVEIAPTNVPEVRHITITTTKGTYSAAEANNVLAAAHGDSYKVTKLDKK